ncbi:MAG TPA: hypothetical protein PK076_12500 [Saprospiraceae bacterium]|nr:hypothetical protein [Saprospiraceae bacterium]HQW56946.1 hypothetical protein [Saprospiraceae bacterium]
MKKFIGYLNLLLLVGTMAFITSCESDPVKPDVNAPTLTEKHDATVTTDAQPASSEVEFKLSGVKGSSVLKSLKVTENGAPLPVSRFSFDGASQPSNIFVLNSTYTDGFTDEVLKIRLPDSTGSFVYAFDLTDANGKNDVVSVTVKVEGLRIITSDTLYNSLGPLAGGLEFVNGKHIIKGTDVTGWKGAHIKDAGNSGDANNHPWLGSIVAWDGTSLRKPSTVVNFDGIVNTKQIETIHAAGTDITSLKLNVGDVFTAYRDGIYFLVKVIQVKDDGKDTGTNSNLDYSRYLIKTK